MHGIYVSFICEKKKKKKADHWSVPRRWLRRSGVRKFPGALITPMGMPIMPPWANDHSVAHVQGKMVPMN